MAVASEVLAGGEKGEAEGGASVGCSKEGRLSPSGRLGAESLSLDNVPSISRADAECWTGSGEQAEYR